MNRDPFHAAVPSAALACLLAVASPCALAEVAVANLKNDFTSTGVAPGWSFLWNANGPIGSFSVGYPQNYVPLERDMAGDFVAPGTNIRISPSGGIGSVPIIVPGPGSAQGNRIERFAIVAYTVSAADIAAYGGGVRMFPYQFGVSENSLDGVNSAVYVNSTRVYSYSFPPGFVYDSSEADAYPASFGLLRPGDTVYVATGSRRNDTGDRLDMDFTLILSPVLKALAPSGKLIYDTNIAAEIEANGLDLAQYGGVYSYAAGESPYEQVRQWLRQGQTGQGGIYTTVPTIPGTSYPAIIAPVDNHQLHLADFEGQPVTSDGVYNQILLKYTCLGDANLDGQVTPADFVNIVANMGRTGSYLDGDVNLDGIIDAADFGLVSAHLGAGMYPAASEAMSASVAVAPEPLALAPAMASLLLGRRPRRPRG